MKFPNFDYENMCLNTGKKHASEQGLNVRNQKDCTVTEPNPNLPVKNAQQGRPTSALKPFGSFCAQYSAKDLFKSLSFFKAEKNTQNVMLNRFSSISENIFTMKISSTSPNN